VAEELLLHGADMPPVNEKGRTFLHLAVPSRSVETVRVFLDNGAPISAQDLEGSSALHLAADNGDREIIDLLINRGARPDAVDRLGRTPLHRSAALLGVGMEQPRNSWLMEEHWWMRWTIGDAQRAIWRDRVVGDMQ
jgi:ankyrin repeat protein